ncbi:MAG: hypothetical protein HGB11_13875 [Chlorobiales bacterium]|nr:hypothetical protein [Chlorobiales bacterium]
MRKLWQHTTTIVTLLLFSVFVVQSTQITQLCQAMSECGESCCCREGCPDASDEITCCEAPSHTATSDFNFELVKQTEASIALAVIHTFHSSSAGSEETHFSHLGISSLSKLSATNPHALLQAFLI